MNEQSRDISTRLRPGRLASLALLAALAACAPPDEEMAMNGSTDGTGGTTQGTATSTGTTDTTTTDTDTNGGPVHVSGGVELNGEPEVFSVVRLTHAQWKNAVEDVFGITSSIDDQVDTLYPDPPNGTFDNNEKSLYVGAELWGTLQRVAENVAEVIVSETGTIAGLGGVQDSTAFINKVGKRAFRRPLSAEEITKYQALWDQGATFYASGDNNLDGARLFIEAILQSPGFVYRSESTPVGSRLSGLELATKLSFLLLNTTPSDELLAAAENGELDTDAGLTAIVTEMLETDEAKETLLHFHSELYGLQRYKNMDKNTELFPEFNRDTTPPALQEADSLFFTHIYEEDLGFRDILGSPVAYVNNEIASFYGLTSNSTEMEQVTLDTSRPGFLTRAGFLTYNANLTVPDPIHRGVDINLRMLCRDLTPPPGAIPPLPTPEPGQTNRELVEAHTGQGVCANCHLKIINPLGFAFEGFNAVGGPRPTDQDKPVNTADTYRFSDGEQSFTDAVDLIDILKEHPQTHSCYSARLSEFLLARDVDARDQELVESLFDSSFNGAESIKQLILKTVVDPSFTKAQMGAAQ